MSRAIQDRRSYFGAVDPFNTFLQRPGSSVSLPTEALLGSLSEISNPKCSKDSYFKVFAHNDWIIEGFWSLRESQYYGCFYSHPEVDRG